MNTRIIAVANIKGGVGKTTVTVNLAAGLAGRGRRVLVIDVDPQANASYALLGVEPPELTLFDVLVERRARLAEIIVGSRSSGVDVAPSEIALSAADLSLAAVPGRERLLARQLRDVQGYDYVLLDTPPSLGLLTINSLLTAAEVFVPVSTGLFALMGIPLLENAIAQVRDNFEIDTPVVTGAVSTLYDRTRVADDTVNALRSHFDSKLFQSIIPKYKDIPESQSRSLSIFDYAPASPAAIAFHSLVEEVIRGEK